MSGSGARRGASDPPARVAPIDPLAAPSEARTLNASVVLRWEYRHGFFVTTVWNQVRATDAVAGADVRSAFGRLFSDHPHERSRGENLPSPASRPRQRQDGGAVLRIANCVFVSGSGSSNLGSMAASGSTTTIVLPHGNRRAEFGREKSRSIFFGARSSCIVFSRSAASAWRTC